VAYGARLWLEGYEVPEMITRPVQYAQRDPVVARAQAAILRDEGELIRARERKDFQEIAVLESGLRNCRVHLAELLREQR
jgi:hypothetical protein